jgi:hypothetical protein
MLFVRGNTSLPNGSIVNTTQQDMQFLVDLDRCIISSGMMVLGNEYQVQIVGYDHTSYYK